MLCCRRPLWLQGWQHCGWTMPSSPRTSSTKSWWVWCLWSCMDAMAKCPLTLACSLLIKHRWQCSAIGALACLHSRKHTRDLCSSSCPSWLFLPLQFSTLEMLGRERGTGHVQIDMCTALNAVPRNFFYVLKVRLPGWHCPLAVAWLPSMPSSIILKHDLYHRSQLLVGGKHWYLCIHVTPWYRIAHTVPSLPL